MTCPFKVDDGKSKWDDESSPDHSKVGKKGKENEADRKREPERSVKVRESSRDRRKRRERSRSRSRDRHHEKSRRRTRSRSHSASDKRRPLSEKGSARTKSRRSRERSEDRSERKRRRSPKVSPKKLITRKSSASPSPPKTKEQSPSPSPPKSKKALSTKADKESESMKADKEAAASSPSVEKAAKKKKKEKIVGEEKAKKKKKKSKDKKKEKKAKEVDEDEQNGEPVGNTELVQNTVEKDTSPPATLDDPKCRKHRIDSGISIGSGEPPIDKKPEPVRSQSKVSDSLLSAPSLTSSQNSPDLQAEESGPCTTSIAQLNGDAPMSELPPASQVAEAKPVEEQAVLEQARSKGESKSPKKARSHRSSSAHERDVSRDRRIKPSEKRDRSPESRDRSPGNRGDRPYEKRIRRDRVADSRSRRDNRRAGSPDRSYYRRGRSNDRHYGRARSPDARARSPRRGSPPRRERSRRRSPFRRERSPAKPYEKSPDRRDRSEARWADQPDRVVVERSPEEQRFKPADGNEGVKSPEREPPTAAEAIEAKKSPEEKQEECETKRAASRNSTENRLLDIANSRGEALHDSRKGRHSRSPRREVSPRRDRHRDRRGRSPDRSRGGRFYGRRYSPRNRDLSRDRRDFRPRSRERDFPPRRYSRDDYRGPPPRYDDHYNRRFSSDHPPPPAVSSFDHLESWEDKVSSYLSKIGAGPILKELPRADGAAPTSVVPFDPSRPPPNTNMVPDYQSNYRDSAFPSQEYQEDQTVNKAYAAVKATVAAAEPYYSPARSAHEQPNATSVDDSLDRSSREREEAKPLTAKEKKRQEIAQRDIWRYVTGKLLEEPIFLKRKKKRAGSEEEGDLKVII